MIYSHEVETMCPVAQGVNHGKNAPDNDQRNDAANKTVEGDRRLSAYSEVVHRSVFVDKSVSPTDS